VTYAASGGLVIYDGAALATTTALTLQAYSAAASGSTVYIVSANITNSIPFSWTSGANMHIAGIFEEA
jgi:hypothetical protein